MSVAGIFESLLLPVLIFALIAVEFILIVPAVAASHMKRSAVAFICSHIKVWFFFIIIIISFFKEQTKARRDKRPNGCSLCSSLTQTLWWLKLKNINHHPTPPTPHHPKSIWKLSRRHWLLPIWSSSSRPQLSVVPSSWRRGLCLSPSTF